MVIRKIVLDEMIDILGKTSFSKGLSYYKEGRVDLSHYDADKNQLNAKVYGSDEYNVNVYYNEYGSYQDSDCDCPAYGIYEGECKHIAAAVIAANFNLAKDILPKASLKPKKASAEEIYEDLMKSFLDDSGSKKEAQLELTLHVERNNYFGKDTYKHYLSLKIGDDFLYVVRNSSELLDAIKGKVILKFGQKFTYDANLYYLNSSYQPFIRLLEEIQEWQDLTKQRFLDKYINLSPLLLKKFLQTMHDQEFNLELYGHSYKNIRIKAGNLPISFFLEKNGSELLLKRTFEEEYLVITPDLEYIFFNGQICRLNKEQGMNISKLETSLQKLNSNKLIIPEKDKEKFMSSILPILKKTGQVALTKELEVELYDEPLLAKFFLDKEGAKVIVKVEFTYGDVAFNPLEFVPRKDYSEKIIIRDYQKEENIKNLFLRNKFHLNKGQFVLSQEEDIYLFLQEMFSSLVEFGEVYYSESFKALKLYNISKFKGGVSFNKKSDLLEFDFFIDEIDPQELKGVLASLKQKKKFHRLKNGSFLSLGEEATSLDNLIEGLGIKEKDLLMGKVFLAKNKALVLDEYLQEEKFFSKDQAFRQLVEEISQPQEQDFSYPPQLVNVLRDYQKFGFKWLKNLAKHGLGGILADEMGLGKTIQTIAFLESERRTEANLDLIIAPTSLVYNWKSELDRFSPALKTLIIDGSKKEREELWLTRNNFDLIITSYPLLRQDIESFKEENFNYVIIDEAQSIKNMNSLSAICVKELTAKGRFALTGTPIENSLSELWSIFDFVMPGYLGSHHEFAERFIKPILKENDQEKVVELQKYLKYFILRRLKKDVVKELPEKIENKFIIEMTPEQKKVYLAYLSKARTDLMTDLKEKGFEKSKFQILALLTKLRQICCHPALFLEGYQGQSGKLEALLELLTELKAGGHRVLLFSQFTRALDLIKKNLLKEDISYQYLDGQTKMEDRLKLVESFNEGQGDVFLISLKAGGTGLNLTSADTVIHFDPWWNPAVENQASDRAHRIGQNKTVHVLKLVTKGTIEEKIFALQEQKQELIDNIIQKGGNMLSAMSKDEMIDLFN